MSSPPKRPGTRSALAALTLALAALLALGIATGLATGRTPWAGTATYDGPLPDCRVDDKLTPHRDPDKWALTLLDPEFTLAADDVPPDLDPIVAVQAFYVMAAQLAEARGMDPDRPRHLSKVTRTN